MLHHMVASLIAVAGTIVLPTTASTKSTWYVADDAEQGGTYRVRVGMFPSMDGGQGKFAVTRRSHLVPGCPGPGDCCEANTTPGCSDVACCEAVCMCDLFCCEVEWDESCSKWGYNNNGCGAMVLCPNICCSIDGDCDDGRYCNGVEVCVDGVCQDGTPVDCDDGVACTVDTCNDDTDSCVNASNDGLCDNGLFCDGVEICDPVDDCQPGTAPCVGQACSEDLDACVDCLTDANCDDQDPCTGVETCEPDGTCVHVMDADCNENGIEDTCDIDLGASHDCQPNTVPDECDIASGTSHDVNGDGIPDECCAVVDPTQAEPDGVVKSRYVSLVPANAGLLTALRMTFADLPESFSGFNGVTMWVGAPEEFTEASGNLWPWEAPEWRTFWASRLQCTPYAADWSVYEGLNVYGSEIVPGGVYEVQAIHASCDSGVGDYYSVPLVVTTSTWGDMVGDCYVCPCTPPNGVTNFIDIAAVVDKFKNVPCAPVKSRVDITPDIPNRIIDFIDIPAVVDAFKGRPYPYDGPSECP